MSNENEEPRPEASEAPEQGAGLVPESDPDPERRRFLGNVSRAAMAAGLVGGYGGFSLIAGRYLYPARPSDRIWQYVTEIAKMGVGASKAFDAPTGEKISIVRQAGKGDADDFIAMSSTCPHLGCQVHWESQNDRYFCPCHNGAFDPSGTAIEGPPAEAGQSLGRYPLRVEGGLLFIEVPAERLVQPTSARVASTNDAGISKPGHDRCLESGNRFGGDKKA